MLHFGISAAQQPYEAYYHFLGDYPYEENGFAGPWTGEAQGLAHDDSHWFITQNCWETSYTCCIEIPGIWKIHVTEDLQAIGSNWDGSGNVLYRKFSEYLNLRTYNHIGDPDLYEYQGTGYLLAGITGPTKGLAVFKADDLSYVDHKTLDASTSDAWVAVDRASPEGFIYFGSVHESIIGVDKYFLNWQLLHDTDNLSIEFREKFILRKENGSYFQSPQFLQGGEFSPSGELLYMSTGMADPDHDKGEPYPEDEGIHVFDTQTWTRIQKSTLGYGYFNYLYDPYGIDSEEPEGLTIWDLDGGEAPGISGQLHVLLLDNDADNCDDIYLKHYRAERNIYVNRNYTGSEQHGTPAKPFKSVTDANSVAWNGAVIHIRNGVYPETLTFQKQLKVVAENGSVVIGDQP